MRKQNQRARVTDNVTRVEQAQTRAELAKTRIEQARTRAELAKTRIEQARTRAELAKTRIEQARTRAELVKTRKEKSEIQTAQVEKTLQRVVHKEFDLHDMHQKNPTPPFKAHPKSVIERLTNRQREILQLIAESQNTKQIAGSLKVSSKTVEYHRRKLMAALDVYDVPGLVRLALRAGLLPLES